MEDSLLKRYIIKLVSTVLVTVLNAGVQILLPRTLSVSEYADYTYNLNFFTSVVSIAILSADGAFASKISKRLQESGLIFFYSKFLLFVILILNVGFFLGNKVGVFCNFFSGQTIGIVLLALNSSLMIKIMQEFVSLFDCYALTRLSEPLVVAQKIILALGIYIIFVTGVLNLKVFYLLQIGIILAICVMLAIVFISKNKELFKNKEDEKNYGYLSEFVVYCRPLVLANIFTNILLIFSNWLLKKFGGDVEQAFYGVAWQLNTLIAYTFTPITVLLQREYAVRVKKPQELGALYQKVLGETMALVSFFACFILVNADYVLETLFGNIYVGAATVTQMIMVYTIFQAWGQVNGAMYSATERTSIYARISIAVQVCSMFCIFLFQIPNFIWPEGLGALGISVQKTVCNMISVILCGYFNCKFLGLKLYKEYGIPLRPIVIYITMAFGVRLVLSGLAQIFTVLNNPIILFLFNGIIYTLAIGSIIFTNSKVLGIRFEVTAIAKLFKRFK